MVHMASVYSEEGNLENAFVLFNKFITLFVEKLPYHRDYQTCAIPEKQDILKKLKEVAFPRAEELKAQLIAKYEAEYKEHVRALQGRRGARRIEEEEEEEAGEEQSRLIAEERQRVARLRQQQLDVQQFHIFEEQLKRQDVVKGRQREEQSDAQAPRHLPPQCAGSTGGQAPHDARTERCPHVNQNLKPAGGHGKQSVDGLQHVGLPKDLCQRFLMQADANTARGIETCGILSGKLMHDEFTITHVIIPKQSGGPDYCDTENEEELFTVQNEHDLITLGWIHTHPTQTAFLSSVDLHTHCSYQLMLPEAIAIVCAPKHNETTAFCLTPAGMLEVSTCREKSFHPHSKEPALYQTCKHIVVKDMNIIILDMR
ncbi:AMSH-like protease [Rhinoraja longicauda]